MAFNKEVWEFENFNFDEVWAALGKSTELRKVLDDVCAQVCAEAESTARAEAIDDGFYADSFNFDIMTATAAKRFYWGNDNMRNNRRRNGMRGKNRIVDNTATPFHVDGSLIMTEVKGDPDGFAYEGFIGYIKNDDYKAMWVEYGSIAMNPRHIFTRAAENVASRIGGDFEILWNTEHSQNRSEMSQKITQGWIDSPHYTQQTWNAS